MPRSAKGLGWEVPKFPSDTPPGICKATMTREPLSVILLLYGDLFIRLTVGGLG